jgi:hypothetical protein
MSGSVVAASCHIHAPPHLQARRVTVSGGGLAAGRIYPLSVCGWEECRWWHGVAAGAVAEAPTCLRAGRGGGVGSCCHKHPLRICEHEEPSGVGWRPGHHCIHPHAFASTRDVGGGMVEVAWRLGIVGDTPHAFASARGRRGWQSGRAFSQTPPTCICEQEEVSVSEPRNGGGVTAGVAVEKALAHICKPGCVGCGVSNPEEPHPLAHVSRGGCCFMYLWKN